MVLVPFSTILPDCYFPNVTKDPTTEDKKSRTGREYTNQAAEKTTDSINENMDNTRAAINDAVEKPGKRQRKLGVVALKDADGDKRMMNL